MKKTYLIVFFACLLLVLAVLAVISVSSPARILSKNEELSEALMLQFPASFNSFKRDVGRYPTSAEGLDVLLNPTDSIRGKWRGPYIQASAPVDPWGQKIVYKYSNEHDSYEIISAGPDGIFGTKDDIIYNSHK